MATHRITTITYDLDERVTDVASAFGGTAGPQVAYNYDPASRMTSELRTIGGSGTSVNTSFSYDAAGRQTTITHQSVALSSGGSGGTTTQLATYVYSYDNADRVTSEKDAEGTASFTYDSANELTTVTGSRSESYTYDSNGNRTGTGYGTTVMNETATSPGTTYAYDNAGNMISAKTGTATTTYTYDYGNRLTEVTVGGTIVATYVYDALNRRIGIDDNGTQTWTVYDGTNPYADFNGSGAVEERYLSGPGVVTGAVVDELLARTSASGVTAWYLPDQLGSVRDIVSASGSELDHVVYDSFGNILTQTNAANGDRFKFAGMEYDSATGQYYDRARNFDEVTGQFTGLDPLGFGGGSVDLYSYVGNSPLDATDPTGLQQSQGDPEKAPQGGEKPSGSKPPAGGGAKPDSTQQSASNGQQRAPGYGGVTMPKLSVRENLGEPASDDDIAIVSRWNRIHLEGGSAHATASMQIKIDRVNLDLDNTRSEGWALKYKLDAIKAKKRDDMTKKQVQALRQEYDIVAKAYDAILIRQAKLAVAESKSRIKQRLARK